MAGDIYFAKPGPTLGANLGSSLGTGLALGIMDLADRKVERMGQRDAQKAFEEIGYSKSQSEAFSKLPREERREVFKRSFNRESSPTDSYNFFSRFLPQQDALAISQSPIGIQQTALKSLIDRGAFVPGEGMNQTQIPGSQDLSALSQRMAGLGSSQGQPLGGLGALQGMQSQNFLQGISPQLNLLPPQMQDQGNGLEILQQLLGQNISQLPEGDMHPQNMVMSRDMAKNVPQAGPEKGSLSEILSRPYERPTERSARLGREQSERQFIDRQALNEKKVNQADKHFNLQQTKDYRERLEDLFKTDQDEARQRKVARQLHERGKLQSPLMASILRTAGLDWDALRSADSQVLSSMIEPALKKLKPTFGANTSNLELLNLLKTHWSDPTKSSTSREFLLDLADVRSEQINGEHEAYRNIMKQTGNNPPPDIRLLVSEQAQQKTDDAFDAFENKWLSKFAGTTAQAGALDVKLVNTFTKAPSAKDNEGKYMKHKGQWFEARNGKWTKVS